MHITWSNELSVGVDAIDNDHKDLIRFYNDLVESVGAGASFDEIIGKLDFMCYYCVSHFGREEDLMCSFGYPETDTHVISHNALQATYLELYQAYAQSKAQSDAERIVVFVGTWLANHIQGEDMRIGRYIRASMAEAPRLRA